MGIIDISFHKFPAIGAGICKRFFQISLVFFSITINFVKKTDEFKWINFFVEKQ
jgi:hypothetical protein